MPKYRATLHVSGITGESPRAVRSALDEKLRQSGLENCHVVRIDIDAPPPPSPRQRRPAIEDEAHQQRNKIGGLILVAAAAWAIWFFWWMLSGSTE